MITPILPATNNPVEPELPVVDNKIYPHGVLILRKSPNPTYRNVRCMYCGLPLFRHYKEIDLIYEGVVLEEKNGVEIQCKRCKSVWVVIN